MVKAKNLFLILGLTPLLAMASPSLAQDRMRTGNGDAVWDSYTIMTRTDETVRIEFRNWWNDRYFLTALNSDVLIDCPNKVQVWKHDTGDYVWKAEGNLWYENRGDKKVYDKTKLRPYAYMFGCLGKLPPDAERY